MPPAVNELSYRILVFGAAISGGALLAIVVQIVLAQLGLDITAIWHAGKVPRAAQLRAATAWWLIAGFTFIAGFAIAVLVRYLIANPLHLSDRVSWAGGLVALAGLTTVGSKATGSHELGAAAGVITGVAVLVAGGALSLLGAFFAMRR